MQAKLRLAHLSTVRRVPASNRRPNGYLTFCCPKRILPVSLLAPLHTQTTRFAHVQDGRKVLSGAYFSATSLLSSDEPASASPSTCGSEQPPDERTLKLGKTIRVLHDRLPSLLASPLPSEIISPQITLHLFPTTHPHLPNASGFYAYHAALWTAPVVWGRVPVIGNIKLHILSERMVKSGASTTATVCNFRNEKLIVRWKTCGKSSNHANPLQVIKLNELFGKPAKDDSEFEGLFIFEFDDEGRIVTHTIEHAQQGGNWEKMTRFVSVTDWLLGLAKNRGKVEEPGYALGFCEVNSQHDMRRRLYRKQR